MSFHFLDLCFDCKCESRWLYAKKLLSVASIHCPAARLRGPPSNLGLGAGRSRDNAGKLSQGCVTRLNIGDMGIAVALPLDRPCNRPCRVGHKQER